MGFGATANRSLAACAIALFACLAGTVETNGEQPVAVSKSADKWTISGVCEGDDSRALGAVELELCRLDGWHGDVITMAATTSGTNGEYRLEDLDRGAHPDGSAYCLLARCSGHSSVYQMIPPVSRVIPSLKLSANPATLSGQVVDEEGRAVAGALVSCVHLGMVPVHQIQAAETDKLGRYAITDLPHSQPRPDSRGTYFWIRHPNFPLTRGEYFEVPSKVDITLPKGGIVEGTVNDVVDGKPETSAVVMVRGLNNGGVGAVRTDANGKYRLILTADRYNIRAFGEERTCVALDSFQVENGRKYANVNLDLIEGGFIVGRVTDSRSGKPLTRLNGMGITIAHYGPAFPRSGSAGGSTVVREDGTFSLRVAPGDNYPYIMMSVSSERTPRTVFDHPPIHVKSGEEVELNMRVDTKD